MKKIGKVLFLWGIVTVLSACSIEVNSDRNLAQDINIGTDSLGNTEKGEINEEGVEEGGSSSTQENFKEEGAFSFVYKGATLIPGELVDHSVLPKCSDVSEVPSCAFGGNDKVYNYEEFELTAYIIGDEERIYSIYFTDPNLPTTEGLCLGDTVDDMISLYGEDYEREGAAYIYIREETSLFIITKNDIVVSIEYRLYR